MYPDSPTAAARTAILYPLPSILDRIELSGLFAKPGPLEVELGSGDGSFLVEYAARHPERNFIGVERLLGRIRKLERKSRQRGLANVRGIRIESSYFLEYLLPRQAASALHIYFPDPWPKRKHRRLRLVSEKFPALASQTLVRGGTVYLRTDDGDYFTQMTEVFAASSLFARAEAPPELTEVLTDFEKEFHARGIPTRSAAYTSITGPSLPGPLPLG